MIGKLKKYAWAVGLVGVALTSLLSAIATNRFIAQKLKAPETVQGLPPPGAGSARQPKPDPNAPAAPPASEPVADAGAASPAPGATAPTPVPPPTDEGAPPETTTVADASQWHENYRIILTRNIFDSATVLDWPETVPVEGSDQTQVKNPLTIRLLGTVAATPAQFSWALVARADASAAPETFRIGDDLYGEGTLKEVRRNQILVTRPDDTEETLDLFTGQVASNAPPAPAPAGAAAPGGLGESIRKISDTKYEIDQKDIKAAMDNMEQLASAARIVPSFENGNPVGFKVFRIKPDSFYNKLGIRNGDVIKKINGFDINSTEKALQMYQILRTEKSIALDITRRGQNMTMEYTIR